MSRRVLSEGAEHYASFNDKNSVLETIKNIIPEEAFDIRVSWNEYDHAVEFTWFRYETEEEEKDRLEREIKALLVIQEKELQELDRLMKKYNKK